VNEKSKVAGSTLPIHFHNNNNEETNNKMLCTSTNKPGNNKIKRNEVKDQRSQNTTS
jgi:hypothetical protein